MAQPVTTRYHNLMSEEQKPPLRRPLGERDEEERQQPFGSRAVPRPPATPPPMPRVPPQALQAPLEEVTGESLPPRRLIEPEDEEGQTASSARSASAAQVDEEPAQPAPPVYDEPAHAPPLIRVRDRRGKVPPQESILKQRVEPQPQPPLQPEGAPQPEMAAHHGAPIQFSVMLRSMGAIFLTAGVVATLFTWWTPNSFLPVESVEQLSVALATQSMREIASPSTAAPTSATASIEPTPAGPLNRVGVVSGHKGPYPSTGLPDPGAVCADGLTEAEINEAVARQVAEWIGQHGYQVDLLDEFDARLNGYRADVIISIHADSCEYINDQATGFKVASFADSTAPEADARLVACMIDRYGSTTGLTFHPSVTFDMTQYHNFREVAPGTPGAIIEIGFMYLDRDLLTNHRDVVALGVARGLLCFLHHEPLSSEMTPTAVTTP